MTFFRHLAAAATLAMGAPLLAQGGSAGGIAIDHPWTRETAPGHTAGGGFMTITNMGKREERLVSASSPVAGNVQIHTVTMDGGVMRMRPLAKGLAIPAGKTVLLKPGSYHLMLMGLKQPLKRGAGVPVTLHFQRAGNLRVQLDVRPIGASGSGQEHRHD